MELVVTPGKSLHGEVRLPGDKSLSHRAALFAALADGESRVENFLVSGVTRAMLDALTALNTPWELEGAALRVWGDGLQGLRSKNSQGTPVRIQCGNSATTLRLLAGALAAAGLPAVLEGSPGLSRRPMNRIVEPLKQMGANIQSTDGHAPIFLQPSTFLLRPLTYSLPVASAQVKTCLLLAALAAAGPTTLYEPGPSRDHTERMLRGMGVAVESLPPHGTRLTPPHPLKLAPLRLALPADFSSAAFLIVAALVTPGAQVTLLDVGLNPTRTGLLDALRSMGADIRIINQSMRSGEPAGDLQVCFSNLRGARVSGDQVVRMIDEFPVFAVAAAYARGQTLVSDASELRHKESDRIAALCAQLRKLGVDAQETADGFIISGTGSVRGGTAESCGDHRLAMALVVAGLSAQNPVTVLGAEIISESFPSFETTLLSLGAEISAGV